MSYLGFPRINFAGEFQADVSTVNNTPSNFDEARFVARDVQQGGAGGWNPRGTGSWRVRNCAVTRVLTADGRTGGDPATAAVIAQSNDRVSAKVVDLDPAMQMVSTVFGLRLSLLFPDGRTGFSGAFKPAPFTDITKRWVTGPGGMRSLGAVYQSVIEDLQWGDDSLSEIVAQIKAVTAENKLSIRFLVDGFQPDWTQPTFTWGRIVGSIGPYAAGEPEHFVAARLLQPTGPAAAAPCRIDEATQTVSLDLANSLATAQPGGSLVDAGVLSLFALPAGGEPVLLAATSAGQPFYDSLYNQGAGILSAQLTTAQLDAARQSPLVLRDARSIALLAEDSAGRWLRADESVFRMSPGDEVAVAFHATTFGQPAAGIAVTAGHDDSNLGGPPTPGVPQSALTFPESVTTGTDGRAELALTAADPANPRRYIDGQVYGVEYGWDGDPSVANGNELYALVWNAYAAPAEPTWVADVQPIMQQFANLYPVMRDVVDLADYSDVAQRHWRAVDHAMTLPVSDPNYMPVTRDMSPAKSAMVVSWLNRQPNPPVFRIDDVASLRQVLQLAIELEHATIPPYLCALFSIVPGTNQEVAELIRSVVMQEMLHMALVCNLLNAVGGHPNIASPAFVPKFPGHLPGGVRPDLTVALRKCSIAQVRDVFMAIEAPSKPLDVPDDVPSYVDMTGIEVDPSGTVTDEQLATAAAEQLALHFTLVEHEPLTIGWFYKEIGKGIVELGDAIFTGDPALQMTPEQYRGAPGNLYVIGDVTHALLALQEIERQGEGTPGTDPTDGPRHELAHYYRFKEIVEGRRMIETSPGKWEFKGPAIPFDPVSVLPMADDPDTGSLAPGSHVRSVSELCDRTYGNLLRSLHRTFNGAPGDLGAAVGIMFSLEVQARELMAMPLAAGALATAGPAFQPA
jgi:ferritin-like protein